MTLFMVFALIGIVAAVITFFLEMEQTARQEREIESLLTINLVGNETVKQRPLKQIMNDLVSKDTASRAKTGGGPAVQIHGTGSCDIPPLELTDGVVDPVVARLIPEHICRRHHLVILKREGNRLTVAMADPTNCLAIDDIQLMTGFIVKPVKASADSIAAVLDRIFDEQAQT